MGTKMYVDSDDLTSVATHIRTKGETSAPLVFPGGFNNAIDAIETGGGGIEISDAAYLFSGGHRKEIMADLMKTIKNAYNFEHCWDANSASAGLIGTGEFDMSAITLDDSFAPINFGYAFNGSNGNTNYRNKMSSIKFPNNSSGKKLGYLAHMCYYCDELLNIDMSEFDGSSISQFTSGFTGCNKLTRAVLPKKMASSSYCAVSEMFRYCTALTEVSFPEGANFENVLNMFGGCTSIEEIDFSICKFRNSSTYYQQSIFSGCTSLKRVAFPTTYFAVGIQGYTFQNCTALEEVIIPITANGIIQLNSSAFTGSGIAAGTGFIYVNDDKVDGYKAATNWSTYADQIKGISEHPDPWWASAQA